MLGCLVSLAALAACSETTQPVVTLPWSLDAIWKGVATGTRDGAMATDTLQLNMLRGNVYTTTQPSVFEVRLLGLEWSWAGYRGEYSGQWFLGRDAEASSAGACAESLSDCAVIIRLFPERNDACAESPTGNPTPIELGGWFAAEDTIVVARLEGTLREVQTDPPPCIGQVMVQFSTTMNLVRATP